MERWRAEDLGENVEVMGWRTSLLDEATLVAAITAVCNDLRYRESADRLSQELADSRNIEVVESVIQRI